jgi:hypothetical protein
MMFLLFCGCAMICLPCVELYHTLLSPTYPLCDKFESQQAQTASKRFWYITAVDDIRDVLTNICLAGAAVSFAACLLIAGKRQLARAAGRIAK